MSNNDYHRIVDIHIEKKVKFLRKKRNNILINKNEYKNIKKGNV